MIEIHLPWPNKGLSPNARLHYMALAKLKAAYRQQCRLLANQHKQPIPDTPALMLEFMPPDRRRRDRDNLLASMKSGIDGVCDALGVDDSAFDPLVVSMKDPVRGGAVILRIQEV
ncbi:hypothetical protein EGK70_007250 [Alcaligenes aquatilis]|uniref:endodeoxyribonuclease RusA n=1 Tax=Alcaligenes aquatilis TaxID=323284 RepID=UPI000F65F957|nr:endodeoxyribonuclease RusA [Alcaligenes aquatilis]QXR37277.1 hypothetical protein EGK70_007250 [Alcaligenes aquatilis]